MGFEGHFGGAEQHLGGNLQCLVTRHAAGHSAVRQCFQEESGKSRAAPGNNRPDVCQAFFNFHKAPGKGHGAEKSVFRLRGYLAAAAIENHPRADGYGRIRHDPDHRCMKAKQLLQLADRPPRNHGDDDKRCFPFFQRIFDPDQHPLQHLRLDSEKQIICLGSSLKIVTGGAADDLCQLLRFLRMPVGEQKHVAAVLGSGPGKCPSHMSCSDKSEFHVTLCSFPV